MKHAGPAELTPEQQSGVIAEAERILGSGREIDPKMVKGCVAGIRQHFPETDNAMLAKVCYVIGSSLRMALRVDNVNPALITMGDIHYIACVAFLGDEAGPAKALTGMYL